MELGIRSCGCVSAAPSSRPTLRGRPAGGLSDAPNYAAGRPLWLKTRAPGPDERADTTSSLAAFAHAGFSKKRHRGTAAFIERHARVFPELHPMTARMIAGPSIAVSDLVPAHQSDQATIFFVAGQRYVADASAHPRASVGGPMAQSNERALRYAVLDHLAVVWMNILRGRLKQQYHGGRSASGSVCSRQLSNAV